MSSNLEHTLHDQLRDLKNEVDRINLLMDGDPARDVTGLRKRVVDLEKVVDEIVAERRDQNRMMKGFMIGLSLNAVTGIGTLVAVLSQVLGIGKP